MGTSPQQPVLVKKDLEPQALVEASPEAAMESKASTLVESGDSKPNTLVKSEDSEPNTLVKSEQNKPNTSVKSQALMDSGLESKPAPEIIDLVLEPTPPRGVKKRAIFDSDDARVKRIEQLKPLSQIQC